MPTLATQKLSTRIVAIGQNGGCNLLPSAQLCSSRAEEEQNSKDLINQQRTSGAEDTELTRILKSCKVCTLQLDISRGWSLATTTSGQVRMPIRAKGWVLR